MKEKLTTQSHLQELQLHSVQNLNSRLILKVSPHPKTDQSPVPHPHQPNVQFKLNHQEQILLQLTDQQILHNPAHTDHQSNKQLNPQLNHQVFTEHPTNHSELEITPNLVTMQENKFSNQWLLYFFYILQTKTI